MANTDPTIIQQNPLYPEAVEQARVFVKDMLLNLYPDMDLEPTRVLNDLLVEPGAIVNAYNLINTDTVRKETSLLEITKNPEDVSQLAVDRILSNWGVTRRPGSKAYGNITIVLSAASTFIIPLGEVFTAGALSFATEQVFSVTAGVPNIPTDRSLIPRGDGTYSVTITITAEETGSAYRLRKGTQIVWGTPDTNYINSVVESDFVGGEDTQSNADLLNAMADGVTAKVMGGRQNVTALIKDIANVSAVSCIGFGDPEMIRDSHNLFSIATGGKADIYVKTDNRPLLRTFNLDCTLLDSSGLFQVLITKDYLPGFYEVAAVYPTGITNFAGSLEIVSDVRNINTSGHGYTVPNIFTLEEGAYTRYQTASVQFVDPDYDRSLSVGDTYKYSVDLLGVSSIGVVQDAISSRDIRSILGDYLVKAPIPMFVAVTAEIHYIKGDVTPDVDKIKLTVMDTVNSIKFNRPNLPASIIVDAIQNVLPDRAIVKTPIAMTRRLRFPDGTVEMASSESQLDIPNRPELSTSSRTVGVYTDLPFIGVNTVQVDTLPV